MWQFLVENDYWTGELWNRHKDGSLYLEHLHVVAVKNQKAEVVYYVGYFQLLPENLNQ
jgi:hypothetical protein